jgi:hypothetical protein
MASYPRRMFIIFILATMRTWSLTSMNLCGDHLSCGLYFVSFFNLLKGDNDSEAIAERSPGLDSVGILAQLPQSSKLCHLSEPVNLISSVTRFLYYNIVLPYKCWSCKFTFFTDFLIFSHAFSISVQTNFTEQLQESRFRVYHLVLILSMGMRFLLFHPFPNHFWGLWTPSSGHKQLFPGR